MLYGLSGKAGSGKSTVASIITGLGFSHRQFAKNVKKVAMSLFGLSEEQCYDPDQKEEIDARWNKSPRVIMQMVGRKMREIADDVWIRYVLAELEALGDTVISDVRFPNECEAIRKEGGFLIRIERPGAQSRTGAQDESEVALDTFNDWDWVIENKGTLADLVDEVRYMVGTLRELDRSRVRDENQ